LTRLAPARPTAVAWSAARSSLFALEAIPLEGLTRWFAAPRSSAPPASTRSAAMKALRALLERDAENIARGVYPLAVLAPESPVSHATRYLRLLADGVSAARRARQRRHRAFDTDAANWLEELPAYYRRNFHFQTNGYLSTSSADLYDHQVQILFRGAADAMRRMILPPLRETLGSEAGRGLRLLELGAGSGSATRFAAMAFPDAKITCLDLSYPYLKRAQERLRWASRVDFIQGDAAALRFDAASFDAVFSVFLLHELPSPVRQQVVAEALRVVRPGGFVGFVDSLQLRDAGDLRWPLEEFPKRFHEPYYRDYLKSPIEDLLAGSGMQHIGTETGFLAKRVSGSAPAPPGAGGQC
jgi:ubiquinone/menaquinone biosynthesis C-methylase UbiE